MNTISPLIGVKPVGSTTSDSGSHSRQHHPRLGQLLKATVIESKGPSSFILDFNGNKIAAESKAPLSIGQTLKLQVTSISPQIELRILSDSSRLFHGSLVTLSGNNINLKSLMTAMSNTTPSPLSNLSTYSKLTLENYFSFDHGGLTGDKGGVLLKQLVDRLGISFEAFLARGDANTAKTHLKSALLELAQVFRGAGEVAEATTKLLNTIELYQHAQLQIEKDNLFIFPLPIPFLEKGYLLIEYDSNTDDAESHEELKFSLHLTLEALGNLRIEFLKNYEGLYLRFFSESKEKLSFIEQFTDNLLPQLVDYPILGISFSVDHVDPASELLQKLLPNDKSIVNTKV